MDKQKIVIYFIVLVMVLSVVGLGVVLLVDSNSSNSNSDDLADQLEQLEQQQQTAEDAQADALACASLPPDDSAKPIDPPEAFMPDGDVTELAATDLEAGDGAVVEADSCLVVHYHGTLASDGEVFDSSFERGSPARFPLANVIEGWRTGLLGMREGGTRRLVIPSELAYGSAGNPPVIAPDSDLVFVVELIRIEQ